jgi:hypothetical protein
MICDTESLEEELQQQVLPDDGDRVRARNVVYFKSLDVAGGPRKLY